MTAADDRARQIEAAHATTFRPFCDVDKRTFTFDHQPEVPNRHGSGTIAVADATITYYRGEDSSRRVTAQVRGEWRRPDGQLTDAPIDQDYADGPDETWPDWLAGLAWYYHPEPQRLPTP